MRSLKTLLTVIGAVTVLVLAGNSVALATTGHALILGKKNSANRITTLKRTTAGSALNVKTTSSADAPLTVNGTGKVANLNADRIDGLDSTAFAAAADSRAYSATETSILAGTAGVEQTLVTLSLPAGSYLLIAKTVADNNSLTDVAQISCRLTAGASTVEPANSFRLSVESTTTSDRAVYTAQGTVTLPAASSAQLACTTFSSDVHYYNRVLSALKVGAIG